MQSDNSKFKINQNKELRSIDGGFLQSKHWGRFQESLGRKVEIVGGDDFVAQMIFHELPVVGGYFFVPRGPLIKISNLKFHPSSEYRQITNKSQAQKSKIQNGLQKMVNVAKKEKIGWIRIEPQTRKDLDDIKKALEGKLSVVKSKKNHEPAETLMIDLKKGEEEILASMKSKTRYNIRLATKRGVEVIEARDEKHIEKFLELTKETAKRDGIVPHPDHYYKKMVKSIPEDVLGLYFAKFERKIISAIMVSFFGEVATYLHGASSNKHRNVMAPFVLQWQAMKDAKKRGFNKYDLGGIKTLKNEENSWAGITRFKSGFCPKNKPDVFPGSWDIIVDAKQYKIYCFLQGISDLKRKIIK